MAADEEGGGGGVRPTPKFIQRVYSSFQSAPMRVDVFTHPKYGHVPEIDCPHVEISFHGSDQRHVTGKFKTGGMRGADCGYSQGDQRRERGFGVDVFRWLTHNHDLVLVAKTYAPPTEWAGVVSVVLTPADVYERLVHGCTTFVWRCADPECSKVVTRVVLGKRVEAAE